MSALEKYYQVFVVSLSEMFVWKLNFVLWRVRQIFQLLLLYFLWSTVFLREDVLFGYEREQILTYVLGVSLIRSFVLSSRSVDVAGEIHGGTLANFLLKPLSYIRWWWARDAVDKIINIVFATIELFLLWLIFKPTLFIQENSIFILFTILAAFLALILFFYLSFLISLSAFWVIEVWGIRYLTTIILEFLAGGFFPLDILPKTIFTALQATPFPYLLFFPIKVYLGQLSFTSIFVGLTVMVIWIIIFITLVHFVWRAGLRVYAAERR